MPGLRLALAFIAGAAAPALLTSIAGACGVSDVCPVDALALVVGLPVGAVAGVFAGIVTPGDHGLDGFAAVTIGIPIGVAATLMAIGRSEYLGDVLTLFGLPIFIGLAPGYGITRYLARGGRRPTVEPPSPSESARA